MPYVRSNNKQFIHTNFLARQKVSRAGSGARSFSVLAGSMGLIILACFFAFLWVRIYVLEVGYQISNTLQKHEALQQENRQLRIERASLAAPSRIEAIARNKLGMLVPNSNQVVVLKW